MGEAIIVCDLSYGDAGKGTTVDYLVRQSSSAAVIRYNGGSQAAHNVITEDGRHHTFAQFGSGSFVPGVVTHLSSDMLVSPINMLHEAEHLIKLGVHDIWDRVSVDTRARVITPWQVSANRLREAARGAARHGSCAQGIGETMADWIDDPDSIIYVGDLAWPGRLQRKLESLRRYKYDQMSREVSALTDSPDWAILQDASLVPAIVGAYRHWYGLIDAVNRDYLLTLASRYERLVFEGAQGVLLDERRGFHPYTTWSTTTPANARRQLQDSGYAGSVTTLGVIRTYTTRHGAGPFVTEDPELTNRLPEHHNGTGEWQGAFRVGHLDLVAHRYAVEVSGGIDQLMVTGVDRLSNLPSWHYCDRYDVGDTAVFVSDSYAPFRIRPGLSGDLAYQQRLTDALFGSLPLYDLLDGPCRIQDLFSVIEGSLKIPIAYASSGPTAADKRVMT